MRLLQWCLLILSGFILSSCSVYTSVNESQLRANQDSVYAVGYYGFRPYWQAQGYLPAVEARELH